MKSSVHLRKGATPRGVHADLGGLMHDERGRNGFTGRTATARRNDPTPFFAVIASRPFGALASPPPTGDSPLPLFSTAADIVSDRPARHG